MKNTYKKIISFVFAGLLICSVFAASKEIIQTEVVSIDKHGNANLAIKGTLFASRGFSASDIVNVKVGNYKFTAPIVKNYSDVDNGQFLVRLNDEEASMAINMGNFKKVTGADVGTKVTITMKTKYGYLTTYHVRLLKKDNDRSHFASDEAFANFRSVTKGNIIEGRLYRSVSPIDTEEVAAPYAAKLMENADVDIVLNLANSKEEAAPMAAAVPYYEKLSKEKRVIYLDMGSTFSDPEFSAKMREGLIFIADHPGCTYYIHGKDGKNRTGFVVSVICSLCGASIDEMNDEYMKSFEDLYGVQENSRQYEEIVKSVPYIFESISGGTKITDKNLQKLTERYLLFTVGLTQDQMNRVRINLTE
ncbi:MAG: SAM-dependent chlorinase/fluorinase [Treponemataceae bacterium]|nr:SAM-dependent chlorinase/fluorinase [Treponemataceae bacterium]